MIELKSVMVDLEEDLYLMANLSPRLTGLPFIVWISPRGNARHDVRVEVSSVPRATPKEMISVGLRPEPHVVAGSMKEEDLELLEAWIRLNMDVLVRYWTGEIPFTEDALELIQKL